MLGRHNPKKDDFTTFGYICYWFFFVLFILLDSLLAYNFYHGCKLGKLKSYSILSFYVSACVVITIRVVLFSDVLIEYPWGLYVIGLITLPTFIYLITGLSLCMCNFELVIKFKNIEINNGNTLML